MEARRRPLAVILLSGGMDSAVAAAEVVRTHRLACLHATYGQRTRHRERVCFEALAHHFGAVARLIITLDHLAAIGGSALTDLAVPVPEAEPGRRDVPATYVPFRNAHLLAAAVSWAEVLGATRVVIGAVEEDSSGYPDCREVFYKAFQEVVQLGTHPRTDIEIHTPVIGLSKAEIVRRGVELQTPFHLTWSCYRSDSPACGTCDSCVLRLQGFAAAGLQDPVRYAVGEPPVVQQEASQAPAVPGDRRQAGRSQEQDKKMEALKTFLERVRQG